MEQIDFQVHFDIVKSVQKEDGRIYVSGIASDESDDISGEVVAAALNPNCVDYLNKFGKLNYDHHSDIIGDITGARFITPDDAMNKYGLVAKGNVMELEGWVQPLSSDPGNKDLQQLHRLAKSGSKIGFSLHSKGIRQTVKLEDGTQKVIAIPTFLPQVAITPQPVNTNAVCIVKSLSKLLSGEYADIEDNAPVSDDMVPLYIFPTLIKSIYVTGEIAMPGATNGDALKQQDLNGPGVAEKQAGKKSRKCCGKELPEGAGYCPNCGDKFRSFAQQTRMMKALVAGIEYTLNNNVDKIAA